MGLSWINPIYLAGLLLLALPLLIHLVQKQHKRGVPFPSLMFLQRIPQRERRRLEIRDRLLLLLRCLLLLLLVLAFSRPFFDGAGAAAGLDPERSDSVIVIDRSYSMRLGERWPQAREAALTLVDEKGASDRIGIILFDEEVEVLSDLSTNADLLRGLLRRPSPGFRSTRLAGAIEQAGRLLAGGDAGRKRIFLVSDFQAPAAALPRITADIELIAQPVKVSRPANAALTAVSIKPSSGATAGEFALAVEVTSFADRPLATELKLTLDGRAFARRPIQLAPGATASETFDRLPPSDALLRGVVSLGDDALALDNHFYFVYSGQQQVPLLIVEGSAARANQSLYLLNALRLTQDPMFRVERIAAETLREADLQGRAAIILNDAAIPGGETSSALARFVAAGGALLVATGETSPVNWPGGSSGYLPGSPGTTAVASRGEAFRITELDSSHPLAVALGARAAIDLSLANVFSYREVQPNPPDRVVARYDDGAPALLERQVGQGRVLLLTTTLDTHWNDLALQPIFLPLLHQGLRYLTAYESYPHQVELGGIIDVMRYARALAGAEAVSAASGKAALVIESPSADTLSIGRQNPLLVLAEPGFYQIHRAAPAAVEVTLAANIDPREAGFPVLDVSRFVEDIRASAAPVPGGSAPTRRQTVDFEQRQQLWYAILWLALLLALIEPLLANWMGIRRFPRARETV